MPSRRGSSAISIWRRKGRKRRRAEVVREPEHAQNQNVAPAGLEAILGFSPEDRAENVRRTAEVARLMAESGAVVIVSLISPYRADRALARRIAGDIPFLEVFVDTPLGLCEARDPKGLYRLARAGRIPGFTGISAPYEAPEQPDLTITTEGRSTDACARALSARLMRLSRAAEAAKPRG